MKKSVLTSVAMNMTAIIALLPSPAFAAADSLTPIVKSYFISLKETVDGCASSPLAKSPRGAPLYGYFGQIMKKNPSIRSLLKVDAKGKTLCERISGERHAAKKRSVAKYQWFFQVVADKKEYDCLAEDKNGRVSLYWSIPLTQEKGGSRRLIGAIIAVIDLRDCFQAIARKSSQPFLIRSDNADIFGHLWKKAMIFVEELLNIPGAENIVIRYQKSNVSLLPQTEAPEKVALKPSAAEPTAVNAVGNPLRSPEKATIEVPVYATRKNMPMMVSLSVLIVIVTAFLIFQAIDRYKRSKGERPANDSRFL